MFAGTEAIEVFPSCLWVHEIGNSEDLNTELKESVNAIMAAGGGRKRTDGGGWTSETDLHERDEFTRLTQYLVAASEGVLHFLRFNYEHFYISECWANLSGHDEDHPRHNHPNALLSGVYYVSAPEDCGAINFYDPRPQASVFYPSVKELTPHNSHRHEIRPNAGMLILFPSWLEHSVERNKSSTERLSISFNVMLSGEIGYETGKVRFES